MATYRRRKNRRQARYRAALGLPQPAKKTSYKKQRYTYLERLKRRIRSVPKSTIRGQLRKVGVSPSPPRSGKKRRVQRSPGSLRLGSPRRRLKWADCTDKPSSKTAAEKRWEYHQARLEGRHGHGHDRPHQKYSFRLWC